MKDIDFKKVTQELLGHGKVAAGLLLFALVTRFFKFRDLETSFLKEGRGFILTFSVMIVPYILLQIVALLIIKRLFYVTYLIAFPFVAKKHELDNTDVVFTIIYTLIILFIGCLLTAKGWLSYF